MTIADIRRWAGARAILIAVAWWIAVLAAFVLAVRAIESAAGAAGPSERLWRAIVAVESGGRPYAYNRRSQAAGIVQIRPIALADVNRIVFSGTAGMVPACHPAPTAARTHAWAAAGFTLDDRFDPNRSRRIWAIYLGHYGARLKAAAGRDPTEEDYARIWNGGPEGWRRPSTADYWNRVSRLLREDGHARR